jgi:hypothetical protein
MLIVNINNYLKDGIMLVRVELLTQRILLYQTVPLKDLKTFKTSSVSIYLSSQAVHD